MKSKGSKNRSVRKTKRMLKEGLVSLLRETPAPEVTVKELCDLVDINRGTFYYYYADIFDMIKKLEEEFFDEFYQIVNHMETNVLPDEGTSNILTEVFVFFNDNAELCEILIGPNGDIQFIQRVKKFVDEKCSDTWKKAGSLMSPVEYELFNSFIINGYIGLLETWLKTGRNQSPEVMANFVAKIIIPAAVHSLSLKNIKIKD